MEPYFCRRNIQDSDRYVISQVVCAQKIMPFLTSGNAKIAGESRLLSGRRVQRPSRYVYVPGIEKDLNMHGFDFNIALTVFYIFVRPLSSISTPDLNKILPVYRCRSSIQPCAQAFRFCVARRSGGCFWDCFDRHGLCQIVCWPCCNQGFPGHS